MIKNKKYFIKSQGCQMNQYDSDKISDLLVHHYNMTSIDDPSRADLLILNTCSIREKAQEKVFSQLGRWRKIKEKNPDALIAVGGCVATQEGKNIRQRAPEVDIVFGPQTLHRLPKMIDDVVSRDAKPVDITFPLIEKFDYIPQSKKSNVSQYVSIMEGCSKYCTFCVVPYTRGEEVSRTLDEIIFEASNLAKNGAKEIILLGQNVNAYKGIRERDNKVINFAELIRYISKIEGIERIRHTTSHPIDFSDDLINEYKNKKLCSNLHLPIQSGSDFILSKMKRKHTILEYKNMIRKVRDVRPDISITSDFIIGYPGESEKYFQETLNLIEDVQFDDGYSFIYSKRPGTIASSEIDNTSLDEKKYRLSKVQDLIRKNSEKYLLKLVNTKQQVLVEGKSKKIKGEIFGRTFTNKIVHFKASEKFLGKCVDVEILKANRSSLYGCM
jgi:tRNA-2-methylthio-N6-dimethylallyladenosine synthase